jgi:copper homeostasis protein
MVKIEICAYSVESCINAQLAGADRIELCAGPGEGGTTPSAGMVSLALEKVDLPIYVMIRPRGGDFVYDDSELEVMYREIDHAKQLGVAGIVLGVLHPDGQVNIEQTQALVQYASTLGVTFHRAFDLTPDPFKALEDVISTGAERILTSGLQPAAPMALELLTQLAAQAAGRIEIMAGGGVSAASAEALLNTGIHALHLSGKAFRNTKQRYFQEGVSMAGEVPDERTIMYSNLENIKKVTDIVRSKK